MSCWPGGTPASREWSRWWGWAARARRRSPRGSSPSCAGRRTRIGPEGLFVWSFYQEPDAGYLPERGVPVLRGRRGRSGAGAGGRAVAPAARGPGGRRPAPAGARRAGARPAAGGRRPGRVRPGRGPAAPRPADPPGRGGREGDRPGHQPVPADRPGADARPGLSPPGRRGPRPIRGAGPAPSARRPGRRRHARRAGGIVRGACADARPPGRADRPVPRRATRRGRPRRRSWRRPGRTARRCGSPGCWMPIRRTSRRPSWRCSAASVLLRRSTPPEQVAPAVPLHARRSSSGRPATSRSSSGGSRSPTSCPRSSRRQLAASVRDAVIEAHQEAPIAGPEDAFVEAVYRGVEGLLERYATTIEDDVEEIVRLYGRRAGPPDGFAAALLARSEAAPRPDLLYNEYRSHPLYSYQGAARRAGEGVPQRRAGARPTPDEFADLTPADVAMALRRAKRVLQQFAVKHRALRLVGEQCRLISGSGNRAARWRRSTRRRWAGRSRAWWTGTWCCARPTAR